MKSNNSEKNFFKLEITLYFKNLFKSLKVFLDHVTLKHKIYLLMFKIVQFTVLIKKIIRMN